MWMSTDKAGYLRWSSHPLNKMDRWKEAIPQKAQVVAAQVSLDPKKLPFLVGNIIFPNPGIEQSLKAMVWVWFK